MANNLKANVKDKNNNARILLRFLLHQKCLITTLNTLDSEFYEQTDGNAMGGAASSPTAEIYIYAGYEENAMSNCTKHSKNFGTILL